MKSEYENMIDFTDLNEKKFGIEPLSSFRKRIKGFFDDILKNYPKQNILIVTHAGVSIYARCYFEGEPKDGDYNKYKLKNCEVIKYENSNN